MSKIALALGSMVLGAIISFGFGGMGSQTSAIAQLPSGPRGFVFGGVEPEVPPIKAQISNSVISGGIQSLDGINCVNCSFENVVIEYAGGSYRLVNVRFSGKTTFVFKGAALNALNMKALVDSLLQPKQSPTPFNKPIPRIVEMTTPILTTWLSPGIAP